MSDIFFSRVHKTDGCWIWTGGLSSSGYGWHSGGGLRGRAHRISYELHHGPIPRGMCVCHSCDNRICVNPDHLWLGTHAENMADMMRKGRHAAPKGSQHGMCKLTEDRVMQIFDLRGAGLSYRKIGKSIGISDANVRKILSGKGWRHLSSGKEIV